MMADRGPAIGFYNSSRRVIDMELNVMKHRYIYNNVTV